MAKDKDIFTREEKEIYDPLSSFKNEYRDLHKKNTEEFFEDLVNKSKVDVDANKVIVEKIEKGKLELERVNKRLKSNRVWKSILIFLIVIFIICFIFGIKVLSDGTNNLLGSLLLVFGLLFTVGGFLLIFLVLRPRIKQQDEQRRKIEENLKKNEEAAWAQMRPLNELFSKNMQIDLFNKTLPIFNFDTYFDSRRLDYLINHFGFESNNRNDVSTLYVQSGDLNGNPFFICRDLSMTMGQKTYEGTLTITWQERVSLGQGKTSVVTRTQTLVAHVTKPCPYFGKDTYIVYGNEAAPRLSFTRYDSDAEKLSEKELNKYVKKEIAEIKKQEKKALKEGKQFTTFGNHEFEVLWGAKDRDNEVEFRLLFTPLATKQLLALMKDKTIGYGDNFNFKKRKMINYVYPQELNIIALDGNPANFYDYDFEKIKHKFISYNNDYFKTLYFSFAPIFAIPIYQQHKPHQYIYKDLYPSYFSFYAHEYAVNSLNKKEFNNPLSKTPNILKTRLLKNEGNKDEIEVTSSGFDKIEHVEFVSKLGGDGRYHRVPVKWIEYIPVDQKSVVTIKAAEEPKEATFADKFKILVDDIKTGEVAKEELARLTLLYGAMKEGAKKQTKTSEKKETETPKKDEVKEEKEDK